MRIKLSQLRRIIREEAEKSIDEMAYAGNLPLKNFSAERIPTIRPGVEDVETKIQRYISTPTYMKRATDLLSGLPVNVWIAPISYEGNPPEVAKLQSMIDEVDRVTRVPEDEAEELLLGLGYTPEEVADKLSPGSAVIIGLHGTIRKNFTPSVWTLLHAFFDNSYRQVEEIFGNTCDVVSQALFGTSFDQVSVDDALDDPKFELGDLGPASNVTWAKFMPFKWTKGDYLVRSSPADLVAECIVASGFRPNGFKFIYPPGTDEDTEVEIEDHVTTLGEVEQKIRSLRNQIRSNFSEYIDGRLVVVNVVGDV